MPQANKNELPLLKIREVCEMLNCHSNTLRSWDKKGYLQAVRIGTRGDRRYKREDIERILKKGKTNNEL